MQAIAAAGGFKVDPAKAQAITASAPTAEAAAMFEQNKAKMAEIKTQTKSLLAGSVPQTGLGLQFGDVSELTAADASRALKSIEAATAKLDVSTLAVSVENGSKKTNSFETYVRWLQERSTDPQSDFGRTPLPPGSVLNASA